jgi:hypothetical protein
MPQKPIIDVDESPADLRLVALGEQAIDNLKRTFDHWLAVGRGIEVGREFAMRVSHADNVSDKGYQNAFSAWLGRHPKYRVIKKATMSWLKKCLDHEAEIVAWRAGNEQEQAYIHYPETVFKHWAKAERPELLTEAQRGRDRASEPKHRRGQASEIDEAVNRAHHMLDYHENMGPNLEEWLALDTDADADGTVINLVAILGEEKVRRLFNAIQRHFSSPEPEPPQDVAFAQSLAPKPKRGRARKTPSARPAADSTPSEKLTIMVETTEIPLSIPAVSALNLGDPLTHPEIRAKRKAGASYRKLAGGYQLSPEAIRQICR